MPNESKGSRTSWIDAESSYHKVTQGEAKGNKLALWVRWKFQFVLFRLGCTIQRFWFIFLAVGVVALGLCCVGLMEATIELDVNKLWVEEGGRLQQELEYSSTVAEASGVSQDTTSVATSGTSGSPSTELLIQTSKNGKNILTVEALKAHLDAMMKVVHNVTVEKHGVTWSFRDVCFLPSVPSLGASLVDTIVQQLLPCIIITPLDCFWDSSKLLGPDPPIYIPVYGTSSWKNLDPIKAIEAMKTFPGLTFDFSSIEKLFEEADIGPAYLDRPCLFPSEADCPATAPNKATQQPPDIGSVMTGGCRGFAKKYMIWPEDLLIGGTTKENGVITKAEAFQTIIQLRPAGDLYGAFNNTDKIAGISGWSESKASEIIQAWQRKFVEDLNTVAEQTTEYPAYPFSFTALTDILEKYSSLPIWRVAVGYVIMLLYAFVSLLHFTEPIHSQGGVAVLGVILVMLSVAAGIGFCAAIGVQLNATTTQIIPFIALGLGVDDMFIIAHTFAELSKNRLVPWEEKTGECLKGIGVTVLLTSISNTCAFLLAAIIPVPALRAFAIQAGVLVIFNVLSMIFIFPAIVSADLVRRNKKRMDILCCIKCAEPVWKNPVDTGNAVDKASSTEKLENPEDAGDTMQTKKGCTGYSLTWFAREYYGRALQKWPVKIAVILFFTALLAMGIWGTTTIKDGLELTDVVPADTNEFYFLDAQTKYFGFYPIYIITKDVDYPNKQQDLLNFHKEFEKVDKIVKINGTLPKFWLQIMSEWLQVIQAEFDSNWSNGSITSNGWNISTATGDGILGYKLLAQTGDDSNPYDKTQVPTNRLVDAKGIINKDGFYNYLTPWYWNDQFAFQGIQAQLLPVPPFWSHNAAVTNLTVPKTRNTTFAQMSFYVNKMVDTETIVAAIKEIRSICDNYTNIDIGNYPTGVPFIFWEQYLTLRHWLMVALLSVLGAMFIVISLMLMNPWAGFVVVSVLAMILVELFGFMGWIGIKLSAIPAVILIVSVGIGVEFTVHVTVAFLTTLGNRNERMHSAVEHMFAPVIHGGMSTLLGIVMLATAEFGFIVKYFFYVLTFLVLLGILNGLVLLPVLLSLVGPNAEVTLTILQPSASTPSYESSSSTNGPIEMKNKAGIDNKMDGVSKQPHINGVITDVEDTS